MLAERFWELSLPVSRLSAFDKTLSGVKYGIYTDGRPYRCLPRDIYLYINLPALYVNTIDMGTSK